MRILTWAKELFSTGRENFFLVHGEHYGFLIFRYLFLLYLLSFVLFLTSCELNCVLRIAFKCALHAAGTVLLCTVNRLCKSTPWIKQRVKSFPPRHSYRLFWWVHCITLNWLVSQNCSVFPEDWLRSVCTCVERQEGAEKRWLSIHVQCSHRHDSHCAAYKSGCGAAYSNQSERIYPEMGKFPVLSLSSNPDFSAGLWLI